MNVSRLSRSDICLPYHIPPIAIPSVFFEQENYQVQLWQITASLTLSVFLGTMLLGTIDIYRHQAALSARNVRYNQDDDAAQNLAQRMPITWPVLGLATPVLSLLTAALLAQYYIGQDVVVALYLPKASS